MIDEVSAREGWGTIAAVSRLYAPMGSPLQRSIQNILVKTTQQALERRASGGESLIVMSSVSSRPELSMLASREAVVALLKEAGMEPTPELVAPRNFSEAQTRIASLEAALARAEARLAPGSPESGAAKETRSERTLSLILAAAVVAYAEAKGTPKYRGTDGRPVIDAVAKDLEKRLGGQVVGTRNSSLRARISRALSLFRAEVGDTVLPNAK